MNQWLFVGAAYGLTLVAAAGLIAWSWLAMRATERDGK
jgi:heme exporter protein CcmD